MKVVVAHHLEAGHEVEAVKKIWRELVPKWYYE